MGETTGHFELTLCTKTLLGEIAGAEFGPDNIAVTYRLALESSEKTDWQKVNAAIIQRWGLKGLTAIKRKAWGKSEMVARGRQ